MTELNMYMSTLPEHDMIYQQYRDFCDAARQRHVIFYYVGYFSQHIIGAMADALKLRLEVSGMAGPTRRKLFSSFVEMSQNIIHYSADALTPIDLDNHEVRHGSVCIGIQDDHYYLLCANPIKADSAEALRQRIEPLRSMTLEEIKQAYKEALRSDAPEDSKGAGVGFLTMARDASVPLEFEFVPMPHEPDLCMFYIKAII
ncbi:SiaB family protein kinase [Silvimonas sp.]|uniref:SiaB family protein kinase n=1 Tax=Silvimonas sp. TaxID=2650811 RepID=UPI0028518D5E|nr:SiaB family protein kinase [Silvimonas sp.]MDR3430183.1 SiaB family protein kinase [Silvimonas sp.]